MIEWSTIVGSPVEHAGTIKLDSTGDGTTRVHIRMSYNPPAGALGHVVAKLFGADPKSEMDEDLMRLKNALEKTRRLRRVKDRARAFGHRAPSGFVRTVTFRRPSPSRETGL